MNLQIQIDYLQIVFTGKQLSNLASHIPNFSPEIPCLVFNYCSSKPIDTSQYPPLPCNKNIACSIARPDWMRCIYLWFIATIRFTLLSFCFNCRWLLWKLAWMLLSEHTIRIGKEETRAMFSVSLISFVTKKTAI